MNAQKVQHEDSDGRESSLSADSAPDHAHHQQVRVLGEPLSDRSSSSQSESVAHRPRTLVDAESRQAIDEYQPEEDSLQFFEEQERQIALQLAQENGANEKKMVDVERAVAEAAADDQHLEEAEEAGIWSDMMSRIEEEEDENDDEEEEDGENVEENSEREEEKEDERPKREWEREGVEGEEEEEHSEKEEEKEDERPKREWEREGVEGEEEEEHSEKEGEKENEIERRKLILKGVENSGSANSPISNDEEEEELPRSGYSHISESLQNREFPGVDLLTQSEEFDTQRQTNSAQQFVEGYPIDYPTDPPPAYSSPRKETKSTARYPVPAPYEIMALNGADDAEDDEQQHNVGDIEGNSAAAEGTTNIRSAIGNSLTLAGGMAAAVLAAPSAADDLPKASPFASPRAAGHGVDSPRAEGGGQRQNAAASRVVQGARTVAELQQQRDKMGRRAGTAKGTKTGTTNEGQKQQAQQKRTEDNAHPLPHLPISTDLKALFGHIEEYVAERVEIVPNWKPFQIDYIPAVGDVDPFIKVPRPDDNDELLLGLAVLDEPATRQSDAAIVDLRLHQMAGNSAADVPVKKLSRADKNAHQIDRWIQSVKELRRTRAPTRMVYGKPMPSIEALMQEWPPEVEQKLKEMKLLINANLEADLEDFVDLCLGLVDIPVHKSRLESLHVLFSLYAEFRASQHFRNMALLDRDTDGAGRAPSTNIDHFVVPE